MGLPGFAGSPVSLSSSMLDMATTRGLSLPSDFPRGEVEVVAEAAAVAAAAAAGAETGRDGRLLLGRAAAIALHIASFALTPEGTKISPRRPRLRRPKTWRRWKGAEWLYFPRCFCRLFQSLRRVYALISKLSKPYNEQKR